MAKSISVKRVWERDGHAGFRFAAPIDVHGFIAEVSPYPRRPARLRLQIAASVCAQGLSAEAVIRDLSQRGAGIESGRQLAKGQPVTLDAPGMPQVVAKVAWRSGRFYGLAFEKVFALEELARLSVALQMPDTRSAARAASCA
ncbi:MAG: PilZ domain-containing protein [Nevskiales bacterium]